VVQCTYIFVGDAFFKAAVSVIPDVPRVMEAEGKHRSSEPFLVDYISNFVSTLLVVPVSLLIDYNQMIHFANHYY
jgi:hypothetical protein